MGLDINLRKRNDESFTSFASQTDPDHLFKVGYFRSSYNSRGFNSIMRDLGLPTLYHVCLGQECDPEDYEVVPDWAAMKDHALAAIKQVDAHPRAGWRASIELFCTEPPPPEIRDGQCAIELADKQLSQPSGFGTFGWYGGLYSHTPMPIIAVVSGNRRGDVYVVYDCPDQKQWLMNALAIVAETADYVLAQPLADQAEFYLTWSS